MTELLEACRQCGIPTSGTKSILSNRLLTTLTQPTPTPPYSIVSLDVGLANFAKAVLRVEDSHQRLLHWRRESLQLPEIFHPRIHAHLLRDFTTTLKREMADINPVYLIERQTFRGGGLRMIPGRILSINRIEVQLHCFLLDVPVYSVEARSVSSHFNLGTGSDKKRRAVQVATDLLSLPMIDIPQQLRDTFQQEKKKDDMADALLQSLAFLSWMTNLEKLRSRLNAKLGNGV